MKQEKLHTLEELMKQGVTRMLYGREVILAPYNGNKRRIGWVYKDTGLPPTQADMDNKGKK